MPDKTNHPCFPNLSCLDQQRLHGLLGTELSELQMGSAENRHVDRVGAKRSLGGSPLHPTTVLKIVGSAVRLYQ